MESRRSMRNHNTNTIPMIYRKFDKTIEVIPFGDTHIGSAECHYKGLEYMVEYVLAEDNRFVVLTGDLVDNSIKSSKGSIYEATMSPNEQIATAVNLLRPIAKANRILCALDGNHEQRTFREVDLSPTRIIALELGVVDLWRHDQAFLYLDLHDGKTPRRGARRPRYSIGVAHGTGGGTSAGAGINKVKGFALSMGVDLLISGHTHRPAETSLLRYEPAFPAKAMVPKVVKLLIGTGWLTYGGYGAEKMYEPLPIAPNKAILTAKEHGVVVVQY